MAVEDEQDMKAVEAEELEVDSQTTPDAADDDDVEAHVWRAQS